MKLAINLTAAAVSLAEEFTFEENDFSGKFLLFRLTHHWVRGLEHWLTRPQTGHMCNFQNQQVTPLISRDATSAFASQWLRWYLPFDCNLPRDHPCTCKCNNFLLIKIVWKCQSMLFSYARKLSSYCVNIQRFTTVYTKIRIITS